MVAIFFLPSPFGHASLQGRRTDAPPPDREIDMTQTFRWSSRVLRTYVRVCIFLRFSSDELEPQLLALGTHFVEYTCSINSIPSGWLHSLDRLASSLNPGVHCHLRTCCLYLVVVGLKASVDHPQTTVSDHQPRVYVFHLYPKHRGKVDRGTRSKLTHAQMMQPCFIQDHVVPGTFGESSVQPFNNTVT